MKKLFGLVTTILLIQSCATDYQESGLSGGYSETRLDENVFRVTFRGNGYTRQERASDFTMLRSAELALEHVYNFFAIIDEESSVSRSLHTTPVTTNSNLNIYNNGNSAVGTATSTSSGGQAYVISKPSRSNTIVCFVDKPSDIFTYSAQFVHESISTKYDIKPNNI